ncbi:MAG: hypothetical protein WD648_14690 [Planctomycetaceae bacterium]
MNNRLLDGETSRSPLEEFLRNYVETVSGEWDEVEPQVYDLMLPAAAALDDDSPEAEPQIVCVTFDPEALADHPQAQLASLGSPLIDRFLDRAVELAQFVELHVTGLNLQPHQLPARITRSLSCDDGLRFQAHAVRTLDFPQLVFWFEITFISDQREQEIVPLGIDLHYGRQVRHLDALLDCSRLVTAPAVILPEARGITRAAAYLLAREQVVRTVTSLANVRSRELTERLDKQVARMTRYYDDMQRELDEQAARGAAHSSSDDEKYRSRREALDHQRTMRIAELRRKNSLSIQMRLLNVLLVHQPKLQISGTVSGPSEENRRPATSENVSLVWDPLTEGLEAVPCPACNRPTFELKRGRTSLECRNCQSSGVSKPTR